MPKFLEVTDKSAARAALELAVSASDPIVFDARDYGVIADGEPHNNVANLLDCVAACAEAGGGTVLLPAGIIDTSEADLGTVTADSGATHTNSGAIEIPLDTPITIRGHGVGVTVLRLSAGFSRAFDFRRNIVGSPPFASVQVFRDVTIRDLTVDRDNLTGDVVASQTITLPSPLSIPDQEWTKLDVSPETFRNATSIHFESLEKTLPSVIFEGDVYVQNYSGESLTLAAGSQTITAGLWSHVLAGTRLPGFSGWAGYNLNIRNVLIEDVAVLNVPTEQQSSIAVQPRDWSWGVGFSVRNVGGPQSTITNIRCNRVRIEGCTYGFEVGGGEEGTWVDDIWFTDCYHDTGTVPQYYTAAANFFIGDLAWVGQVGLVRCEGRNSWDVGFEVDQPWVCWEIDCRWSNANYAVYRTSFVIPSRTAAGPPSTLLNTSGGTLASNATTCTVDGLPEGVDREGLAQISSGGNKELVWYQATNTAGTTWKLWRGFNESTAVSHSDNAVITFIQTDRTRVHSIRSNITLTENLTTTFGSCWATFANDRYPAPPLTIRDATATVIGGNNYKGRFIRNESWCPEVDIEGVRMIHTGYTGGNAIDAGRSSAIYFYSRMAGTYLQGNSMPVSRSTKKTLAASRIPCPPPLLRGRNNTLTVSGAANPAYDYTGLHCADGYLQTDFDLDVEFGIANCPNGQAVYLDSGVIADESRLGIGVESRADQVNPGDTYAFAAGSNLYLTIASPIKVDIDASRLSFASNSTDSNYKPWFIEGNQAKDVQIHNVAHSGMATRNYPSVKTPTVVVTASESPYTVQPDDQVVMVDSSGGAVTVNLPSAAGGAPAGQSLTLGSSVTIIDAGLSAGTNNITVTPSGSEKINGQSGNLVLRANGETRVLSAVASMPGWVSMTQRATPLTSITGAAGENIATFASVGSSAGNFMQFQNSVSGNPEINLLNSAGSDVSLAFLPKGSGGLSFYYVSGNTASIRAGAAATDCNIDLVTQAAGKVKFNGVDSVDVSSAQTLSGKTLTSPKVTSGNAPAAPNSTGTAGQVEWDSGFIYVCVATNEWKRAAISPGVSASAWT